MHRQGVKWKKEVEKRNTHDFHKQTLGCRVATGLQNSENLKNCQNLKKIMGKA